jgi:uncharacterized membrane protein
MTPDMIGRDPLLALHLLGAVAWVGGMLFAMTVLRPALSVLTPKDRLALHLQVLGRFFRMLWHVMPIVILTGYAMIFGFYGGFAGVGGAIHAMHGLGLLMAAIFIAAWFGPFRALRRAMAEGDTAAAAAAVGRVRRLVWLNLALGLVTVALGAFG